MAFEVACSRYLGLFRIRDWLDRWPASISSPLLSSALSGNLARDSSDVFLVGPRKDRNVELGAAGVSASWFM